MRRKGQALDLMWFFLFIAVVFLWGTMAFTPQSFNKAVEIQIDDQDPRVKSALTTTFLDREYVKTSLEDAVYTGIYRKGGDIGVWGPGEVPSMSSIEISLEEGVSQSINQGYLGSLESGGGCSIDSGDVTADILGEQGNTMELSLGGGPVTVECVSLRQALLGSEASIRSTRAVQQVGVPGSIEVPRLRYRSLAGAARTVATDPEFQDLLREPAAKSSRVATKECGLTRRSRCDYREIDIQFGDDMPIEQLQEEKAGQALETELDSLESRYEDEFDSMEVTIEIEELEYRPYNIEQVSQGSTGEGCSTSRTATYTEYDKSCSMLEDCDECDEGGVTCSEDERCPFDPSADCRNDCDAPDWAGTPLPSRPVSQSGTWTDGRWESTCGSSDGDPYPYSGGIDWTGSDVDYRSFTLPLQVRRSGTQHLEGGDVAGEEEEEPNICTAQCVEDTETCSQELHPDIRSRESYRFDLQSFTRVRVTVKDTANRIPTGEGFRNPEVSFYFEAFGRSTG